MRKHSLALRKHCIVGLFRRITFGLNSLFLADEFLDTLFRPGLAVEPG
jgi:hypothetical protein